MATPPPVETVIDLGQTRINRPVAPALAPAPSPGPALSPVPVLAPATVNAPTVPLSMPAVQPIAIDAMTTPPEFLERLNRVYGQTGQKGDAGWSALPGTSSNRGVGLVPGFVRLSPQGVPVRGATNVTTVPRAYQPGDGNP